MTDLRNGYELFRLFATVHGRIRRIIIWRDDGPQRHSTACNKDTGAFYAMHSSGVMLFHRLNARSPCISKWKRT